ncbi:hypothetical protein CAC42_7375 [Sphaceloma murrayae]|uniref:Secreted protein n=1 Tax=Sphaceloma murrayae TaxID=2082308 RepID=A0A2K1QWV0_9PEZI|nr:hypothetical protein CAC42_7375 [Sphaceloma murrayae]
MLMSFILCAALAAAHPFSFSFGDPARMVCVWKNPQLVQAIDEFCKNPKIVVPSSYGANGKINGNNVAWIWPQGDCPSAYVPQQYCYSQFYSVCAKGNAKGYGKGFFGRPGEKACQVWLLDEKRIHDTQITWRNNGGPTSRGSPPNT